MRGVSLVNHNNETLECCVPGIGTKYSFICFASEKELHVDTAAAAGCVFAEYILRSISIVCEIGGGGREEGQNTHRKALNRKHYESRE